MTVRERPPIELHDAPAEHACVSCGAGVEGFRCGHCGAAKVVNGYRVERLISQGPHSRVYQARSPGGEKVALKELVFALVPDVVQLEAFEREAKILKALDHPRIPKFIDSFQDGSGVHTRLYLVQQFVEGTPLSKLADRANDAGFVEAVARDVLEVLAYLHTRQPKVLHRDIKPANLILGEDGRVKVVDFGAALAHPRGATHGATLVGTFGYMPPEQLGGTVNETSDLYALGASLLHLLTGRPPTEFLNTSTEIEIPSDVAMPERLRVFLHGLTARRREQRYRTAATAQRALDGLEEVKFTSGERQTTVPGRGLPRYAWWVAAGLIALGVGLRLFGLNEVNEAEPVSGKASASVKASPIAPVVSDRIVQSWVAHDDPIQSISWSPERERIATSDSKGVVRIWHPWTGSLTLALDMQVPADVVAFSPDGQAIAIGSSGGEELVLWEVAPESRERFRIQTTGGVQAVAFSPDGREVLTGGGLQTGKVWHALSGKRLRELDMKREGGVRAVAYDPRGRFVALGSGMNDLTTRVKLFGAGYGEPGIAFDGHAGMIHAVAVSSDGETIASASADSTWLWSRDPKHPRRQIQTVTAPAGRISLAFSPDGTLLARANSAAGVELFDVATGRLLTALVDDVALSVNGIAFSPDGRYLAGAGNDRQVRIWDVLPAPIARE